MDSNGENMDRGPARSGPRDSLFLLTNLSTVDGTPLGRARVRNLSATGLMADCERAVPAGIRIRFDLRGIGQVNGSIVWSRDDRIGIAFDQEIDPQLARRPVSGQGAQAPVPDYLRTRRVIR
ncbi:type IV pilus assembly PilZ [Sphingobium chlorophenolicum L-1]|uniref:Type IV pilus assembly PilZ n=1 Tax=Sphingobium chlorophenolicum L-1 TaxID=690566 RepID=F6EV24_SPHCR|nr:PilZ domain-containing protein [Sphingobium chlorophenolicum]AEG47948.1 type IV pilus assembly PilZ [Sphingobium chlorophenolicum L-1]